MKEMQCAICSGGSEYKVLYQERFTLETLNENTFSARRTPDRSHYRIVRCQNCGLVFSTPVLEDQEIERLYRGSKLTYDAMTESLQKTYGFYLQRIGNLVPNKDRLLEIGCGNGFFLEKALELGYKNVYGVEPSSEAISKAAPAIARNIVNDVFTSGQFEGSFFDVICFFQTLDHVIDPNEFLRLCYLYLKPGGIILSITHNIDALSSRLLGEKCPMIDIEHIYLFNKKTLREIFSRNGFHVIEVFNVANTFPIEYYLQMMPLPGSVKDILNRLLSGLRLKDINITAQLGNIGIIARKGNI